MGRAGRPVVLGAGLLAVAFCACGGERRVHPPPEGEWLEWEPKGHHQDQPASKPKKSAVSEEPASSSKSKKKSESLEDSSSKTAAKPKPPPVTCSGQDVVKESFCVAQTELGAVECPEKIPRTPNSKNAGVIEAAPKTAKRDPSLEERDRQCCYAWCVKAPSMAIDTLVCKASEVARPLFCFEAPASGTKTPAAGQYGECPAGLKRTIAKGTKRAIPLAGFSPKETKDERGSSPKACCYESCKK